MIEIAVALALARVQVVADEFSLTLSRQKVKAGPVLIQLVNFGEDDHDLRPGRYRLWCTLGDHHERGMEATLVVF